MACRACPPAVGSLVTPITMKIWQLGSIAPLDHHLRPRITYSSPSRVIVVAMLVASLEATSGSVMQNADLIVPSSSGRSQRSCCSGDPNSDSTSMLPVSGAAQFSASGASVGLQPVISASGAYCKFVSGGSGRLAGLKLATAWADLPVRKRFHSPRLRASALSSPGAGAPPD